jgi:predicted HTH transcriptional regulator
MEAPFQSHSSTSRAAADEIKPSASTLREQVFELLKSEGPMTDEEIQVRLDMNPNTQRPRRVELVDAGRVTDSGQTKLTKSRRHAVLWKVTG